MTWQRVVIVFLVLGAAAFFVLHYSLSSYMMEQHEQPAPQNAPAPEPEAVRREAQEITIQIGARLGGQVALMFILFPVSL